MKNEFISTVSHELRTPLTSIRGALGLVANGITGEISAKAKELIDIASNNSIRLINLINDILDIEKIEAGKMEFNIELCNLIPVLEQAVEANSDFARQYSIDVEFECSMPEVKVKVDKSRTIQVLTNLFSNAVKFSRPNSQVKIAVLKQENKVRVLVTNYAYKIPEEFHDRIFQKFAQADSSNTRQKGGTGLGLNISKAIIERMGGQIDFSSNDKETTFYFDLPDFTP